jgi:hypothetical protein
MEGKPVANFGSCVKKIAGKAISYDIAKNLALPDNNVKSNPQHEF